MCWPHTQSALRKHDIEQTFYQWSIKRAVCLSYIRLRIGLNDLMFWKIGLWWAKCAANKPLLCLVYRTYCEEYSKPHLGLSNRTTGAWGDFKYLFLSDNKGRPMLQPRQRGASSLRLQDGHVFQQINTVKNSQCKNNAHAEYMLQNPGTPENKPSTFPHFLLQHFHYCWVAVRKLE